MTPIDQTIMHDPDNGQYGDCQRACFASLLDLSIDDVPHFGKSGDDKLFHDAVDDFLKINNLFELQVAGRPPFRNSCYHLIYGLTKRGTRHAVVGLNGVIVHDPHPSKSGLLESDRKNWVYAFIIPSRL